MENKVYVLIKCEIIEVFEDSYCSCCGPSENLYNDDPKVIGVYQTLYKLKEELTQLEFDDWGIKYIIKNKYVKIEKDKENFYYLEEGKLN